MNINVATNLKNIGKDDIGTPATVAEYSEDHDSCRCQPNAPGSDKVKLCPETGNKYQNFEGCHDHCEDGTHHSITIDDHHLDHHENPLL